MTIASWLAKSQHQLSQAGIQTARLDALVLLEDQLAKNRAHILAHPEIVLKPITINVLNEQIVMRADHSPLAYVRGKTEFYGRNFIITSAVLVPRPESEAMIDTLKELTRIFYESLPQINQAVDQKVWRIADIGTGSGALGITAKLELPSSNVNLIDIDYNAIEIAKRNVALHTIDARVILSNLLNGASDTYDIFLCNLPYVPDDFSINLAATHEPKIAIFGGSDGLNVYRELFNNLHILQQYPLYILTESFPHQHRLLAEIANQSGYAMYISDDYIQAFINMRSHYYVNPA